MYLRHMLQLTILVTLPPSFVPVSPSIYHLHRILLGVAETPEEIAETHLLESNFDFMNGMSPTKPIYFGKEQMEALAISGKRLVPVVINQDFETAPKGTT